MPRIEIDETEYADLKRVAEQGVVFNQQVSHCAFFSSR